MAEDVDSEGTDPFPAEADLDLLALDELWVSNTRRITIYHELVTSCARSTRLTTLLTNGTGFALIVIVGVVGAVTTDGLPGAISTSAIAVAGAALTGYIGKTVLAKLRGIGE